MLRRGVSLTANYGPDGRACQLHVLPALDLEQSFQKYGITDEIITAVLDELLPTETRGVEFGEGTKGIFLYIEYENAVFVRRKGTWGDSEVAFAQIHTSKPSRNKITPGKRPVTLVVPSEIEICRSTI
jgi:hypothetical protein